MHMQILNIAIFTNLFPNKLEPERGNFIALMTKKLAQKAHIQVISPLPWFPKSKAFKKIPQLAQWSIFSEIPKQDKYEEISVSYPKYFFLPKIGFLFQPLSIYFASYNRLKKLHKEGKVDIINAHWIFPDAVVAVYISKKLGIPSVISARGCDINRYSSSFIRRIQINWALQHADAITVVSNALKQKIIDIYNIEEKKISIIPNGVDETLFHPMNKKECQLSLGLETNKKRLLFVGQLHPVKNIKTLLKALSIIKNDGELNFETLIIGTGPLESELKSLATELLLTSTEVVFKGQQSHSDIATFFGAADLLCLPSIREGRPNVIIEALATGLPVVASNVGGIPEMVNEKNGILVSPSDHKQLALALSQSMNKKWDRTEISNTQSTSSWDGCAEQYLNLFLKKMKRTN